jgi:hypothetical protein
MGETGRRRPFLPEEKIKRIFIKPFLTSAMPEFSGKRKASSGRQKVH